jgi:hypothetical protein
MAVYCKVLAPDEKHAVVSGAGLRPDERDSRKRPLDVPALVADLHDQQSPGAEKVGRSIQYSPHERQTIRATGERDPRLAPILGRQLAHGRGADVGRVGDDKVVLSALEPGE